MSWAFITALKKNPQQSYVQLLNSIRDELQTRYTQKPQLSCSHPLGKFMACISFLRSLPFSHETGLTCLVSWAPSMDKQIPTSCL